VSDDERSSCGRVNQSGRRCRRISRQGHSIGRVHAAATGLLITGSTTLLNDDVRSHIARCLYPSTSVQGLAALGRKVTANVKRQNWPEIKNYESPHSRSHRPLCAMVLLIYSFRFRSAFRPRCRICFFQFHVSISATSGILFLM